MRASPPTRSNGSPPSAAARSSTTKGEITINNPKAAEALKTAAGWVGTITPEGVLNYTEEEARGVFQAGNAAFMRNWPYAWALAQGADSTDQGQGRHRAAAQGRRRTARHAGTLGGQLLAVSKYSKNADAATDLVLYLTEREEQKRRAIAGSFNPTIASLYKDADIAKANPVHRRSRRRVHAMRSRAPRP